MPFSGRFILVAAFATAALGQEFEAVSVKPDNAGPGSSSSHSDRSMLTATNVSLRELIGLAYGINRRDDFRLQGPDWLTAVAFDVSAKFPEAFSGDKYTPAATQAMMQKMLADRFGLVVHRERKTFPVYGLVVGSGAVKLKPVAAGPYHQSSNSHDGPVHYEGKCVTMDNFAAYLTQQHMDLPEDLPVVNMTGLQGCYDMTFEWSRSPRQPAGQGDAAVADPSGPVLTEAIQKQFGLRLESRKAPLEILVVDHAERAPTAN